MTRHRINGDLAGEYTLRLAGYASASENIRQYLEAVLVVEPDNAWHVEFRVCFPSGKVKTFDGLSKAVRAYEEGEPFEQEKR